MDEGCNITRKNKWWISGEKVFTSKSQAAIVSAPFHEEKCITSERGKAVPKEKKESVSKVASSLIKSQLLKS